MSAEENIYDGVPPEFFGEDAPFFTTEDEPEPESEVISDKSDEEEKLVFDESYKLDFQKLLTLGKLTATFKWAGHTFRIRTLKNSELLEIGEVHRPYMGTMSDVRAWTTILASACLESIDNKPLPVPINKNESELEAKFNYMNDRYYQWVIDAIYTRYLEIERRAQEIVDEMGKASGSLT